MPLLKTCSLLQVVRTTGHSISKEARDSSAHTQGVGVTWLKSSLLLLVKDNTKAVCFLLFCVTRKSFLSSHFLSLEFPKVCLRGTYDQGTYIQISLGDVTCDTPHYNLNIHQHIKGSEKFCSRTQIKHILFLQPVPFEETIMPSGMPLPPILRIKTLLNL